MMVMVVGRVVLAVIASAAAMLTAVPIVLVGLPFWLVAVLTRAMVPVCQPPTVRWPGLFEYHPILGWKIKPNFSGHCLEERDDVFQVNTGPDGWPGKRSISESKVVVFGDSYAFGYGVDSERTFFHLHPYIPIKSIGAPGYNMVQEVLLMEELSSFIKDKIVVWFVYFGNDLYDNLAPEMNGYRMPFVARDPNGEWRITTTHINPSKWSCSVGKPRARYVEQFFAKSFLAERAFSACEFLIERGREICHRASAELVIMTIPHPVLLASTSSTQLKIDPEYPDQRIRAICDKLKVPLVALREILDRHDYKEGDEHWTERGHRKVAHAITEVYHERVKVGIQRQEPARVVR